ncbi:glycosyltransferase family 4 protein [Variovorax ginsengisoli]|uniref:Glycosyltransferase n=1 Tax=Variovorax ginsengisoli TaxID=363844 RepID=A0ABT8SCU7_9BURK|nr:glycosyltransferase [Variovorax ginsengisoli]MDN8617541.1 glycosyltransferase [Variovorax ginsengisoli]MDO1536711.1 glycosyltransferase [Variovorax ginsengisoli]
MNIVIFSPLATTSAIGRVTTLIVRALFKLGHSAVVVRTEQEPALGVPAHDCETEVLSWTDAGGVELAVRDADALFYQIGNNYTYHCGALHWLRKLPGIVCLHDFLIAHLFAEWAHGRRHEAEAVLRNWYGDEAAVAFFNARSDSEFMDLASRRYPMTEWICSQASAVISHSHWGMPRVAASCAGPLKVLALPYDAPGAARCSARAQDGHARMTILTVGHANPNKRIDSVIRAIGSSEMLARAVTYRLCGRIEAGMAADLAALAKAKGVDLVISGETTDDVLQEAMLDADIVCCLRWPSFESASATTIEGLLYGKAVVVTDAAFYREIPDDCVYKISPYDEVAELSLALEELITDSDQRLAMAHRGQAWAERTFDAELYVAQLSDLARLATAAQPVLAMAQTLIDHLRGWGASEEIMTSDQISRPLTIFGNTHSSESETPPSATAAPTHHDADNRTQPS